MVGVGWGSLGLWHFVFVLSSCRWVSPDAALLSRGGPACRPTAIRDLICSFSQHKTLTNTTEVGVPSGAPGGMKKPETIQ